MNITKLTIGKFVVPAETLADSSTEHVAGLIRRAAHIQSAPKQIEYPRKIVDPTKGVYEILKIFKETFKLDMLKIDPKILVKAKSAESITAKNRQLITYETDLSAVPEEELARKGYLVRKAFEKSMGISLNDIKH